MGRSLKIVLLLVLLVFFVLSCDSSIEKKIDQDTFFGELRLDSTELLITTLADSLEVPWDLTPGPEGWIWFTQQDGSLHRVHSATGELQHVGEIKDVFFRKSTGLLSLVLHPKFPEIPNAFVHYTYAVKDSALVDMINSRIVRLNWENGKLGNPQTILDGIPGNTYHNGSRMLIGSDGCLWIGTGDAGQPHKTQALNTLNGKVLRLNLDGSVPADNPDPASFMWSRGHRNIQGITQGHGSLYTSEHGPNNDDEVNRIQKGHNYGWPDVQGYCDLDTEKEYCQLHEITEPMKAWTPTIATAGLSYYDHDEIPEWKHSLLLATLKGQSLRQLRLNKDGTAIIEEHIFLQKELGRIRDIAVGDHGEVYIATSNLDWHPGYQPWMYDSLPTGNGDRILKIEALSSSLKEALAAMPPHLILRENPEPYALPTENFNFQASEEKLSDGQKLYMEHCAACHRADGHGNPGMIPPLTGSEWVSGNPARLIDITLKGLNTPITVGGERYEGEMPAYERLQDEEISDILNFIRIEFGKVNGNIIAADILHQRKGL